jgi:ribosomal protein L40E
VHLLRQRGGHVMLLRLWHRLLGLLGGQCLSMTDYVAMTEATDGAPAPEGASSCLCSTVHAPHCARPVASGSWVGSLLGGQRLSMKCPRCQADNREGARFCRECGATFGAVCSSCGAKLEAGSKFCDGCGTPLVATPAPGPGPSRPCLRGPLTIPSEAKHPKHRRRVRAHHHPKKFLAPS